MEGSFKAVKNRNCGGVGFGRSLAILLRNAFVISLSVTPSVFSQTFDVLIVESPEHLVVYDAFQQSLPALQEHALQPFVPMKILKDRDVLSDGLTSCTKVQVDAEAYYLLLNDRGRLAGSKDMGTVRIFRNVKFVDDTIAVLESRRIVFQNPFNSRRQYLTAGERCICYFEVAGVYYAKRMESESGFGWLRLPDTENRKSWRIVHAQSASVDLSPMIRNRLVQRIDDVNLGFTELYALLNNETGRKLPVPQWRMESTNASLVFVLRPSAAARFYKQSIASLMATLQTYLVGTGYDVLERGNVIQIVKR